uniref:DNA helicase MCM9 n=1 Tax=Phallusia mammillata TaxID=59560 RepID=A0A6F9DKN4_9ASCI|nr:DNA helicase MCM9 [Phallusia mammillata]
MHNGGLEENSLIWAFSKYLNSCHVSDIIRVLLEEEVGLHYSIYVNASDLLKQHGVLADSLFFRPEETLASFDKVLVDVMQDIYNGHMLKNHMVLKTNVHARLTKLPLCPELWRERIPKSKDVGCFLAVEGTVIRTNSVKILEYEREYMCAKCSNVFTLQSDFQLHHHPLVPNQCPVDPDCRSKKFVVVTKNSGVNRKCKDYQEVKIQEQVRKLSMGTIPRCITVVLEDDLVDSCKAGDDVVVLGHVVCRWNPLVVGKFCDIEMTLIANNLEVWNEKSVLGKEINSIDLHGEFECFWAAHGQNTMVARNHILASLCPQLYGLYVVKLAVALVLAGGVQRTSSSGSSVRGECHLLLVGDPGTGKSQFLKYVAKITPRSVITTGIGSSAAGLTVSAIRDGPHWSLEAGALVLADGGICCIDEFSSIKDHDRAAIHEAMEQQTISVAKAGLVSKLHTRTSILAATNPKLGKYDEMSSVSMNIAIASPLLSRFDIVLVLLDTKNTVWDDVVCNYLLHDEGMAQDLDENRLWDLEQMQAYFGLIRQLQPTVSIEADQVLQAYYHSHRQSDFRNKARTTIRLLESLIRLSEAHARIMFRDVVTIHDAIAAVTVMESSMEGCSLLPTGSILHSCFPDDPEAEFKKHAKLVLHCLKLDHLVARIEWGNNDQNTEDASSDPNKNCPIPDCQVQWQEPLQTDVSSPNLFNDIPILENENGCLIKKTASEINVADDLAENIFCIQGAAFSQEEPHCSSNTAFFCSSINSKICSLEKVKTQQKEKPSISDVFKLDSTVIGDICTDFEL